MRSQRLRASLIARCRTSLGRQISCCRPSPLNPHPRVSQIDSNETIRNGEHKHTAQHSTHKHTQAHSTHKHKHTLAAVAHGPSETIALATGLPRRSLCTGATSPSTSKSPRSSSTRERPSSSVWTRSYLAPRARPYLPPANKMNQVRSRAVEFIPDGRSRGLRTVGCSRQPGRQPRQQGQLPLLSTMTRPPLRRLASCPRGTLGSTV